MWAQRDQIVTLLLAGGATKKSDLFVATALGHAAEVKQLLDTGTDDIDAVDEEYGMSALDVAVFCGQCEVHEILLGRGATSQMTDVYVASGVGNAVQVAALLSENDSDIDTPSKDNVGFTPLLVAAWNGHSDVVRVLLDAGSTVINESNSFFGI